MFRHPFSDLKNQSIRRDEWFGSTHMLQSQQLWLCWLFLEGLSCIISLKERKGSQVGCSLRAWPALRPYSSSKSEEEMVGAVIRLRNIASQSQGQARRVVVKEEIPRV